MYDHSTQTHRMEMSNRRDVPHAGSNPPLLLVGQGALAWVLVLALCLTGLGCSSGGANGGGEERTPPAAPSGLEATSADGHVQLDWEAVSDAHGYTVYRSTSPTSGPSDDPLEQGVVSASYVDLEVVNGTTYYYRVTAVGVDGRESDTSDEAGVTPFDEPPSRP